MLTFDQIQTDTQNTGEWKAQENAQPADCIDAQQKRNDKYDRVDMVTGMEDFRPQPVYFGGMKQTGGY